MHVCHLFGMFDTLQYNLVSITGKLRVRCNSQYCINMSFIATPSICPIRYMTKYMIDIHHCISFIICMYMLTFIVSRPNATHSRKGGRVSRDALLVIHIPLLHFSFYPKIPQRNDTSPFWKSTVPTLGVTLTYFIWYVARYRFLSL